MAVQQQGAGTSRSGPDRGWAARFFGVAVDPQTWRDVIYLIVSFPIGVTAFVLLATFLSAGAGLTITLVGIPILVAAMYGWCAYANWDRSLTNLLLGTRVPKMSYANEKGYSPWDWTRLKRRIGNPNTWRSLGYLFLRFPHGLVTFVFAVNLVVWPLWAVSLPFHYRFHNVELGPDYAVNTFGEAMMFAAAGPVVFFLGLHLLRAMARVSGAGTATILGSHPRQLTSTPWESNPAEGDAYDALKWRGLRLSGRLDPHTAQVQSAQIFAFKMHLVISGSLMLLLAIINGVAAPNGPWALWPIWGLLIPLSIHGGYLLWGWIGAHAGLFAIINLGLLVIDLTYSQNYWFYWPLLGWGVGLAISTFAAVQIRKRTAEPDAVISDQMPLAPDPGEERPRSISVDVEMRRVTVDGVEVEMTPKEFDLLVLLYENPGRPFNRGELLDRIWKNEYEVTERTVDACVVRLRRKLGGRSEAIQTVWGVGYRFQAGD